MIAQWEALLDRVEIIERPDCGSEFKSLEELNKFEAEEGIIFPVGYKEFCQVFGTGCFGDFISIFCPNIDFSNLCLEAIKSEIVSSSDPALEKMMSKKSLLDLLDSSFVFGREPSSISIFWDLSSYDELDKSCNIYWANSEDFSGDIYKIGRDFYKFVTEFCLGDKSYEILPEQEWRPKEAIQNTFTRVKPMW